MKNIEELPLRSPTAMYRTIQECKFICALIVVDDEHTQFENLSFLI